MIGCYNNVTPDGVGLWVGLLVAVTMCPKFAQLIKSRRDDIILAGGIIESIRTDWRHSYHNVTPAGLFMYRCIL
jgi:hypothetical protein